MGVKAPEPPQLVVEVGTRHRIAVGQINRRDTNSTDVSLQVARLTVGIIARKPPPHFNSSTNARQNGDSVVPRLTVPNDVVAGSLNGLMRKGRVPCLHFLKTSDVGLTLLKPLEKTRHSPFHTVHVERRNFHGSSIQERLHLLEIAGRHGLPAYSLKKMPPAPGGYALCLPRLATLG